MKRNFMLVLIAAALIAAGAWWYTAQPAMYEFQFAEGETISSWSFKGAYTGNTELENKAKAEISRLEGLFGSKEFTDYVLYVSIANQYNLMGDGEKEYEYLRKALAVDSEHTGLAWHNLGKLLERFYAYKSARIAYDNMVQAQAAIQYQSTRLEFLRSHMPEDTAAIKEAETKLNETLGELVAE